MKVYVYNSYDDKEFIKELVCPSDDIEFDENGLCIHRQDCNDTVNDAYYTDGFGHKYFDCFNTKKPSIESDKGESK